MNKFTKYKKIEISGDVILTVLVLSFTLPIFRSGGKENLTFIQWIVNHTIFGEPVQFVPEEDYITELSREVI